MATIEEYDDFKRENKSAHAQELTDFAIVNFLEYALCSKILVDDVPDDNIQANNALTQDPSPGGTLQSRIPRQSSLELETYTSDSETMTISGDLSDAATINSATPEHLSKHFRDSLSPPYNASMTYDENSNSEEIFGLAGQIPHEGIASVRWKH